jgi:hypothetical protein
MAPNASPSRRSAVRRSVRSAVYLVRLARRHAAALFNGGFREAAVGLYESAAKALLAPEQRLPIDSRRHLRAALRDASRLRSPAARAWRLGTALEHVARGLAPLPAPALARAASSPDRSGRLR